MGSSSLELPLGAVSVCIEEQENIPGIANREGVPLANDTLLPSEPMTPPPKRRRLRGKDSFQDTCVPHDECHTNSFSSRQPAIPRCCTNEQAHAKTPVQHLVMVCWMGAKLSEEMKSLVDWSIFLKVVWDLLDRVAICT